MILKALDYFMAGAFRAFAPVLRGVGRNPGKFPAYRRNADKAGVHLRTTHYYEPLYSEADLPADTTGERDLPGLDLREESQLELLSQFNYQSELTQFPDGKAEGLAFSHQNPSYSYADAESLYCMLRHKKPKRVVEIGSGFSTRIAHAALVKNAEESGEAAQHICIEPYEAAWLEQLPIEIKRERVEHVDLAWFDQLEAGDVLFIDSSHVIRPYGDVLFEYQQLIPRLKPGVIVHVHDIFTPRDYPEAWLRADRRLWNEQYLLEVMLAQSSQYRVLLALNWLRWNHGEALERAFPSSADHPDHQPGAFWFEV